jgi:5-methylcytosine-specific restriction endonuclease McrA
MGRRALTVCRVPGCSNTEPCEEHPARNGSTYAWRKLRAEVLRRDYHLCVRCGRRASEVDHIVPVSLGGRDELSNLRSLCHDCHAARPLPASAPPRLRRRL